MSQDGELTARQTDVLGLLSYGAENDEIARLLNLTRPTVWWESWRLRRRLRARNTAHAVSIGFQRGILR